MSADITMTQTQHVRGKHLTHTQHTRNHFRAGTSVNPPSFLTESSQHLGYRFCCSAAVLRRGLGVGSERANERQGSGASAAADQLSKKGFHREPGDFGNPFEMRRNKICHLAYYCRVLHSTIYQHPPDNPNISCLSEGKPALNRDASQVYSAVPNTRAQIGSEPDRGE